MQIILNMKPRNPLIVPFNYNYQLQSAIYGKLREIDRSDFWHDKGFGDSAKFKAFTFGSLKGRYTVRDDKIHFEDTVSFEIRSPIFNFCDDFQRAVEYFPDFRIFNTELDIISAYTNNRHINQSSAVFTAQTAIVVYKSEENYTHYFSPEDDEFFTGICNNYENKYTSIFQKAPEPLYIRPVGDYKKVVTNYKHTWVTGYKGKIEVKASSHILEFLYNAGIGSKNSQGFGFIDI